MNSNDITALTRSTDNTNAATSAGRSASLGSLGGQKDQFLKLLLAQLKHQDPLQPPDASKFSQEMIQFGQLEQLFNLNNSMEQMATMQNSAQRAEAIGLMGRKVDLRGDTMQIAEGKASDIGFKLQAPAEKVTIEVVDQQGHALRTIELDAQAVGTHSVPFDGKDDNGNVLADGTYGLRFEVPGGMETQRTLTPLVRGEVTGVSFDAQGVLLTVDGRTLPMDQIIGVSM